MFKNILKVVIKTIFVTIILGLAAWIFGGLFKLIKRIVTGS